MLFRSVDKSSNSPITNKGKIENISLRQRKAVNGSLPSVAGGSYRYSAAVNNYALVNTPTIKGFSSLVVNKENLVLLVAKNKHIATKELLGTSSPVENDEDNFQKSLDMSYASFASEIIKMIISVVWEYTSGKDYGFIKDVKLLKSMTDNLNRARTEKTEARELDGKLILINHVAKVLDGIYKREDISELLTGLFAEYLKAKNVIANVKDATIKFMILKAPDANAVQMQVKLSIEYFMKKLTSRLATREYLVNEKKNRDFIYLSDILRTINEKYGLTQEDIRRAILTNPDMNILVAGLISRGYLNDENSDEVINFVIKALNKSFDYILLHDQMLYNTTATLKGLFKFTIIFLHMSSGILAEGASLRESSVAVEIMDDRIRFKPIFTKASSPMVSSEYPYGSISTLISKYRNLLMKPGNGQASMAQGVHRVLMAILESLQTKDKYWNLGHIWNEYYDRVEEFLRDENKIIYKKEGETFYRMDVEALKNAIKLEYSKPKEQKPQKFSLSEGSYTQLLRYASELLQINNISSAEEVIGRVMGLLGFSRVKLYEIKRYDPISGKWEIRQSMKVDQINSGSERYVKKGLAEDEKEYVLNKARDENINILHIPDRWRHIPGMGDLEPCVDIEFIIRDKVFEEEFRVNYEDGLGAGLGLSDLQRRIEGMDGKVWVRDSKLGEFTTFSMLVPIALGNESSSNSPIENSFEQTSISAKFMYDLAQTDRKSTRLNSSHIPLSRMPSSA